MKINAVVVILLTSILIRSHSASAQFGVSPESIDANAGTASLLGSIQKSVSDAIESSQNSGNYRLFKSTTELKSITDSWKRANSDLNDKAYKALDKFQQEFVEGADTVAKKLEQNDDGQLQVSAIISKLANQAVTNVTIFHGKPAVFGYTPRVIYPGMKGGISFTIRGINFKKANPRRKLQNGRRARRVSLSNQEAVFSIPLSVFKFERSQAQLSELKFGYLSSKKKREWIDIPVLQLPQTLAEFTLQIKTRDSVRDTWEGSRQFYWAGNTDSKTLSQGPHDNGWRIMPSSLRQGRVWGAGGKGCSVVSNDERGFAIEVKLEANKKDLKSSEAPNQYCEWHWKETFDRQVITPQAPINGNITWLKNLSLPLPVNSAGVLLQVMMWNGNEYAITSSHIEPFFEVIESEGVLEINPRIPADLNVP